MSKVGHKDHLPKKSIKSLTNITFMVVSQQKDTDLA